MVTRNGIKEEDLNPETLTKLGQPMPPRPDVSAMGGAERMREVGKYYDANEKLIKSDILELGEEPARIKWGCKPASWAPRLHRMFPDKYPAPPKKGKAKKPAEAATEKAESGVNHIAGAPHFIEADRLLAKASQEIELAYLKGWYDCTRAHLRAGS